MYRSNTQSLRYDDINMNQRSERPQLLVSISIRSHPRPRPRHRKIQRSPRAANLDRANTACTHPSQLRSSSSPHPAHTTEIP
ncbi:hypothetical protein HZ326_14477 [Fusarium oxysporum f. sp. albedinis]|nr:hypothetical protein HZ326_14477 [Fusarium oxysporum f. sp. albedinis]